MTGLRRSTHRHGVVGTAAITTVLVLGACGSETQVSSPTSATPTSVATSTSAVATLPPTTVPVTTQASVTTAPPATTAPPPTAPPVTTASPANSTPASAFVVANESLLEVDPASGATVRVVEEFFNGAPDPVFRGEPRLSPDRSTIWFSEGYEDSWYGCESSVGSFGRVDVTTGEIEVLGVGSGVEPSPDGGWIAYVTSSLCLPDPEAPDMWVLTPNDRVVMRDLATGEEREFVTDDPPDAYGTPGAVEDLTFTADAGRLLVLMGDGRLFNIDPDGPNIIQQHPVLLDEVPGVPVAAVGDLLLTVDLGDEGSTDVYAVDPYSGSASLMASSESFMAVGVDAEGSVVVSSSSEVSVVSAGSITVVELEGDPFVSDIDW